MDGHYLEMLGVRFTLSRRGDSYWLTYSSKGVTREKQIVLSTGSHHFQTYWIETDQSREVGSVPFVWLIDDQRWAPTTSIFVMPPDEPWRNTHGRWTSGCSSCHTTNPRPRRTGLNSFDTHVSEFGISCEACHGPGEQHVKDELTSSIVNPSILDHRRSAQVCGQCHGITGPVDEKDTARYNIEGPRYRPGQDLHEMVHVTRGGEYADHPRTSELYGPHETSIPSMFWSDGMVRVSGREYNGMLESPCFARGEMSCVSCHQLHQSKSDPRPRKQWANDQLQHKMQDDRACLQCHESMSKNIEAHTHHKIDSTGSRCMNCHMSYTNYGLLKALRSHTIASPSVRESVEVGRPNACNQCHLDKTLKWTDGHMQKWYEHSPAKLTDDQQTIPATALWLLTGDAGQRALAAWTCGWQDALGKNTMTPYLGSLLADPYPAVRYIAQRSLRAVLGDKALKYDYVGPPAQRQKAKQHMIDQANAPARRLIERLSPLRNDREMRLLE